MSVSIKPPSHGVYEFVSYVRAIYTHTGMQRCSVHPCAGGPIAVNLDAMAAKTLHAGVCAATASQLTCSSLHWDAWNICVPRVGKHSPYMGHRFILDMCGHFFFFFKILSN